jgi:tetratricopeptide (TPR) repeat protein
MKNTLRTLAALLVLLPALPALAGTQGRVSGKVLDSAGSPVEGVTVTVTTPSIKSFKIAVTTKKDGSYGFIVNDATLLYDLKMEKEGFAGINLSKQKFSTIEVTVIPNQSMLKTSEAPAGARPAAGPAKGAAAPSSSEQAAAAYNAAVDLLNAGDKAGAEAKLKEAVAKSPDLPQAWHALAIVAYDNKDWAKTLEYGQKALDLDPSQTDLYGRMKDAADKGGDKKASAEWQKKYDEVNADTPEVLYNKGVEAWNKKKAKDAEDFFTKAVTAKPEFAMAHFQLGMVSLNLKKNAAAKEHLQKYVELDPKGAEAETAKEILSMLK